MVICLGQDADLHMTQLMPLPLTVSCSSKSRLVLSFWYRLTRVVPDKSRGYKTVVIIVVVVCLLSAFLMMYYYYRFTPPMYFVRDCLGELGSPICCYKYEGQLFVALSGVQFAVMPLRNYSFVVWNHLCHNIYISVCWCSFDGSFHYFLCQLLLPWHGQCFQFRL